MRNTTDVIMSRSVDVSDALLGQTLARARRALDDTGGKQRMIRTMPRFGYRWVAATTLVSPDELTAESVDDAQQVGAEPGPPASAMPESTRDAPSKVAGRPARAHHARDHWLAAGLTLSVALAGAWIFFGRVGIEPPPRPSTADMYLVLPVTVRDTDERSRWIRLGAMDYLAFAMRQRGQLPVLPSDQAIAYLVGHGEAELADPAQRLHLAQQAGAATVLTAVARD